VITATAAWGRPDTIEAIVTGNLVLTSDRRLRGTPAIYQINLARPDSIIPLYVDTRALFAPALSPDRRRMVFSASTDGRNYDLWIADADGKNAHALSVDSLPETTPSWTPDGLHIVYTVTQRREKEQLAIINVDGTGRRILTIPPGTSEAPVVSPDGRSIAFVGTRDRKPDIYVMDIAGTGLHRVTSGDEHGEKELGVHWLQNGDLAVLASLDHDHGFQIARITAGTNARSTLVTSAYPIESFSVSHDGNMIAYVTTEPVDNVRNQKTKTVLYLVPVAAGSTPTAVRTAVTETIGFPTF
jgi:TolB protein